MSTTERGRQAETMAARYLEVRDLEVVERNWRTRYSEIDLIARSAGRIHFVEIKYRANANQGDGFAYITPSKQGRLIRAAAAWCQQHKYTGPYQIDVMSVTGDPEAPNIEWLENVVQS